MEDGIRGLVPLLLGFALVLFRNRFADYIIASQNRFWGFRFGPFATRGTQLLIMLFGVVAILFGILILLRFVPAKG